MYAPPQMAERMLQKALAVVQAGEDALLSGLNELPAAIYITDPEGVVTYFNAACVEFTGRSPEVGQDRWCVTWKLYTDEGEFLPHDQCPMAVAIQDRRPIRGVTAVAERPDGTRVNFQPYPTPLFAEDGELRGAVNMLIDVSSDKQAAFLRAEARRCRRLAFSVSDEQTTDTLNRLAAEYEARALGLDPQA
jgi:PAS domain S-box-containing protein